MYDKVLHQIIIQINWLNEIAATSYQQGQYEQGIHFAQQACDQAKAYLGKDHPSYAQSLNNLASLYQAIGRFSDAEPVYRQARKIRGAKLGTDHPDYATTLNNLAELYRAMGRFDEAESLYQQALEIREAKLGTNHPSYASSLNSLAVLYQAMGRFDEAEVLYRQALKIVGAKLGRDDPFYAACLSNLAELYKGMSRFDEAGVLYRQALKIVGAKLGTDHPNYAATLNNLAELYRGMSRFNEAETLYLQVREIWGAKLATNHPSYATSLNNLAALYQAIGRFDEAELLYRQAKDIREAKLGTDHPDYAASLNNLALLYRFMGRFDEAEPLYRQNLEIMGAKLSTDHPNYAATLNNLAVLIAATNHPHKALHLTKDAVKIENQILGQIFSISSDNQRLTYLQQIQGKLYAFLSLVTQYLPDAPEAVQAAFDLVLRRKALGAEAAAIQRSTILSGRHPDLARQLEQLRQLDNQIASLAWNVPPPEQLAAYQTQLATLYQQRDEIDRSLSRQIPEMNLQKQLDTADRSAIAKALPDGATLVEFVRFDVFNFKAIRANGDSQWLPARYLAFILPAKEPEQVQMIDLGEAESIDKLIRVFRKSVSKESDRSLDLSDIPETEETTLRFTTPEALELRQKLIDPLKPYLKQQQLFLAPDGELACLPFGVLPTAEGGYLMEDYALSYLSVGRDVLRFNFPISVQVSAPLVIANPDYNLSNADLTVGGEVKLGSAMQISDRQQLYRDLGAGQGEVFKPIPGTQIEGEQVAKLLGVPVHTEAAALKSLVTRCHSPQILHIATHGYFLEDIQEKPKDILGFKRLKQVAQQNPLVRSGLAFAGANTILDGGNLPPEAEDALLTAQSATGLNLTATALVVASACQTALGNVQVGEGVLGLRRAFMLAGAQTLVMSLWSVPDVATAILMERLYHYLLQKNMGRAKALEQAQFYVRDLTIGQMRECWLTPKAISRISQCSPKTGEYLQKLSQKSDNHRPYVHPMYWGAFICQGNPTPVSNFE